MLIIRLSPSLTHPLSMPPSGCRLTYFRGKAFMSQSIHSNRWINYQILKPCFNDPKNFMWPVELRTHRAHNLPAQTLFPPVAVLPMPSTTSFTGQPIVRRMWLHQSRLLSNFDVSLKTRRRFVRNSRVLLLATHFTPTASPPNSQPLPRVRSKAQSKTGKSLFVMHVISGLWNVNWVINKLEISYTHGHHTKDICRFFSSPILLRLCWRERSDIGILASFNSSPADQLI